MTTKNEITGDKIKSRPNTDSFEKNFEKIFGKPKDKKENKK